ncbi:MAG: 3-dehydroquinate synthase [Planctomycetes bacterium]|nr:3-dehydroquinate synthase [Planctomycetota bacterium]
MTELVCSPAGQSPSRIRIERGCRARLAERPATGSLVTCDGLVRKLHPDSVPSNRPCIEIEGGEPSKSFATLEQVTRALASAGIDRSGEVVAIGGGTIGDLAGFAAATYLRGIRLVQVPTTLLAMVDSSVGGKTAINLPEGKNLVGAFWPPAEVLIDPEFLTTLPDAEYLSGLGEVLKMAIGLDADLFEHCERESAAILARDLDAIETAIRHSVETKVRIVESDFREAGDRKLLNLGHTIGHALESHSGYSIAHGVAVARGIHYALDLARDQGTIDAGDARRAHAILDRFGFESTPLPPARELAPFIARDKKRAGDAIDWVLPTGIGASTTVPLEYTNSLPIG